MYFNEKKLTNKKISLIFYILSNLKHNETIYYNESTNIFKKIKRWNTVTNEFIFTQKLLKDLKKYDITWDNNSSRKTRKITINNDDEKEIEKIISMLTKNHKKYLFSPITEYQLFDNENSSIKTTLKKPSCKEKETTENHMCCFTKYPYKREKNFYMYENNTEYLILLDKIEKYFASIFVKVDNYDDQKQMYEAGFYHPTYNFRKYRTLSIKGNDDSEISMKIETIKNKYKNYSFVEDENLLEKI